MARLQTKGDLGRLAVPPDEGEPAELTEAERAELEKLGY